MYMCFHGHSPTTVSPTCIHHHRSIPTYMYVIDPRVIEARGFEAFLNHTHSQNASAHLSQSSLTTVVFLRGRPSGTQM